MSTVVSECESWVRPKRREAEVAPAAATACGVTPAGRACGVGVREEVGPGGCRCQHSPWLTHVGIIGVGIPHSLLTTTLFPFKY